LKPGFLFYKETYNALTRRIFSKHPVKIPSLTEQAYPHKKIKQYGITFAMWTVTDFSHE